MRFQSVIDAYTAEKGFRTVQNCYTATLTITAGTIAIGSPVVLATATNSLPSNLSTSASPFLPGTTRQNFGQNPATSTSLVNNLLLGILASVPGTKAYLDREETGVVQCYGPYVGAKILRRADAIGNVVGAVLIPELVGAGTAQLGVLLPMVGAQTVNAVSTATVSATPVEVPALGALAVACQAIASSSATETTTGIPFLRCM
jgi:hypothetical protein